MAKFEFKGIDTYIKQLNKLQSATKDAIIGRTVYAGAAIVADKVRATTEALAVGKSSDAATGAVTAAQKRGLLEGFGISKIQDDDGFINVKLGFDGYNSVKTKKYPNGQPNVLIARAVNSGTTFRKKTRFVDKAVAASRKTSEAKMAEVMDSEIEKIMK